MHVVCVVVSVQLSLPSSMRIMRGFDHVYVAAQLHFHWGTTEVPGSEHTIDHDHFPAEVMVSLNTAKHLEIMLLAQSFWNTSDYEMCDMLPQFAHSSDPRGSL